MRGLFTYGPGIPRYLGMWLVLTPVLVAVLWRARLPRLAIAAIVLTTIPTLAHHDPPTWLGPRWRWAMTTAALAGMVAFLVARLRPSLGDWQPVRLPITQTRVRVLVLVGLALVVRVPLAWWDPGISDIATSTELASNQLLDGDNPYVERNADSVIGKYQYPAGTLLANTPLVALVPERLLGEEHLGVRATSWLVDAAAVALLAWAGARFGRPRAGLVAALAYALSPVLVRDGGLTAANDLLLALLAAAAAIALAARRPLPAAVLVGLAISVKPTAIVLVPLLLAAVGWTPALVALVVPALVQAPFLLWPSLGLHGFGAIAEPVARGAPFEVLRTSTWWPVYAGIGHGGGVLKLAAAINVAVSASVAWWAGRRIRSDDGDVGRSAAAVALPLLVSFALAPILHLNYEGWYLSAFVLAAAFAIDARRPAPVAPR